MKAAPVTGNKHFDQLIASGHPVGEVIAVDRFIITIKGMQPCSGHALVLFEDGSKGFVHQILPDKVIVLHLGVKLLKIGMVSVIQYQELVSKVGKDYVGRVVSVTGEPLDGKGPIAADDVWPVFNEAPPIYQRKLLGEQLESGVTAIDAMFPIVRGQRMALLGDSKSGKSTLVTQMTINQKNTDQIVVYALIAKRRSDVDDLLSRLEASGGLSSAIVVVSTMFESLIMSYIAPYVACAMAEYIWQRLEQDTIIIYDDLTSHAHAHREVALLTGVSPGRDSYPGDMFYAHSSLVERAGRLEKTGKHLTAISLVNAAGGDVTAFLPTNIMSMTDGQWVLDMDVFREGVRPALSTGLSVTRAGGIGHNKRQKALSAQTLKMLVDYRQAKEYSQFGTELGPDSKKALIVGAQIHKIFTQAPTDVYSVMAQQLMLDIILNSGENENLDVGALKLNASEIAQKVTGDENYEAAKMELINKSRIGPPKSRGSEDSKEESSSQTDQPAPSDAEAEEPKKTETDPLDNQKDPPQEKKAAEEKHAKKSKHAEQAKNDPQMIEPDNSKEESSPEVEDESEQPAEVAEEKEPAEEETHEAAK